MKKVLLAAAVSAVALFSLAASASAFTAEVSPGGEISTPSTGKVSFIAGGITIECNLTLRGSLARSVTLTAGQSLGSVSSVSVAGCVGGEVERILGLPWNIRYDSTTGTLPSSVTAVNFTVVGASFQLGTFGRLIQCLYRGDAATSMEVSKRREGNIYTSGTISTIRSAFTGTSGGFCPGTGEMTGRFTMSPAQTIAIS